MRPAGLSRTNHFQECFEESEANLQESYVPQGTVRVQQTQKAFSMNDEQPIQLIQFQPSGRVQVNDAALDLISQYNKPVGFVCLAGKYRTGKSFLLNKLLDLKGSGFKVDSSTTACTEGIWMWSKPLYNERQDCYLFFLDTEGSDSTNRDSTHDAKIFTLAILISSYFIFNSVGAIDQMSIGQLNLVTTLSRNIAVASNEALHNYMPKFLWLLRDFVLQIKDERGRRLSPTEYLESCLLEQNAYIRMSQSAKNVRRAIVNNFKERDCMMLVRPANQESDLKNLAHLPNNKIRKEFLDGVAQLKEKIFNKAAPKTIGGQPVNALIFTQLIENYVEVINKDGVPNITSAWEQVSEQAGAQAYNSAIDAYNTLYSQYFAIDEPKGQQIHSILKQMHDKALDAFDSALESPNDRYRNKLKNFLYQKELSILKINEQFNSIRNVELLRQFSANVIRNIEIGKYSAQNSKALAVDLNEMINRYNTMAKGPKKCEVLSQFLINFNPMLLNSYTVSTSAKMESTFQSTAAMKEENEQKETKIRMLEQMLQSKDSKQTAEANTKAMKFAEQKKKIEAKNQQLKKQIERMRGQKEKAKGCCALF